jgi:hypothetical protein
MRSAFDGLDGVERCARRRRQRVERRCQLCRGAAVDEREGTAFGGSHIRRIRAQQNRHRFARTGELAHLAAATALGQTCRESIGRRDILADVEGRLGLVAVEILRRAALRIEAAPGEEIENAFVIFVAVKEKETWRVLFRVRVRMGEDGTPAPMVEAMSTHRVGFTEV